MGARSIATATLGPGPVSTSAETRSSNAAISNATAATPSTTAAVAIALATLAVAADPRRAADHRATRVSCGGRRRHFAWMGRRGAAAAATAATLTGLPVGARRGRGGFGGHDVRHLVSGGCRRLGLHLVPLPCLWLLHSQAGPSATSTGSALPGAIEPQATATAATAATAAAATAAATTEAPAV